MRGRDAQRSRAGGQNGSSENDPPALYGIRVFRDGTEVLFIQDVATSPTWVQTIYDFTGNPDFEVTSDTVEFEFNMIGYAPIDDDGGTQI